MLSRTSGNVSGAQQTNDSPPLSAVTMPTRCLRRLVIQSAKTAASTASDCAVRKKNGPASVVKRGDDAAGDMTIIFSLARGRHGQCCRAGSMTVVGPAATRDAALDWERDRIKMFTGTSCSASA